MRVPQPDDRAGFHRRHAQVAAGRGHGQWRETVFIPEDDRGTLCVSSQVELRAGMHVFAPPAVRGFNRNLSTAEIIGRKLWWANKSMGVTPKKTGG